MVVSRRMLVVYNPHSSRARKERAWERLHTLVSPGVQLTRLDLSMEDLNAALTNGTYEAIIAIGGDGTVRAIIQTLHERNLPIPIALIPRGTANLIANSLRIPRTLAACAEIISKATVKTIDIARINNNHYFVGAFAAGYLSSRITSTTAQDKQLLGFGGYLVSFIRQTRFPFHVFRYTVDGITHETAGHTLFIVNTTSLLGIASKRPHGCDDGVFELVVTTNKSFMTLPALIWEFYFKTARPRHFVLHRGTRFSIELPEGISTQMDGEKIDVSTQTHIEVMQLAQQFFVP